SATRIWPMNRKDEYAHALWKACDMPPVLEFLEQYRPYVDWDDLDDWRRRGHTVGLHTDTHPFCSRLTPEEADHEVIRPARELRVRLKTPRVPFAYPFGDRFVPEWESDVAAKAELSCMLGIGGLSRIGTPLQRLDRARGETGLGGAVFFGPLVK